jgi:hypothetical protein
VTHRSLQHALDELRFGRTGTLNLRTSMPNAADAVKRADAWLRMKQAEGAREVLVITGRGNGSFARVPVVREAVRRLLGLLATRGVVEEHGEHSPGSFAVRLAPLSAATARRAVSTNAPIPTDTPALPTLDGLLPETREQLRLLAAGTLRALGVRDASQDFIRDEMIRQCGLLAANLAPAATASEQEQLLQRAIQHALERLDDDQR